MTEIELVHLNTHISSISDAEEKLKDIDMGGRKYGYKIWVAENMWFYVIVDLTFYVENLSV